MTAAEETIPKELGRLLNKLGQNRGGKVACLVLLTPSDLQMIYPDTATPETISRIEALLLAALLREMGIVGRDASKSL